MYNNKYIHTTFIVHSAYNMLRNTPKHLMSFCTASYKPSALFNRAEPIQPTCGWPHIAQCTGWLPGLLTTSQGRTLVHDTPPEGV